MGEQNRKKANKKADKEKKKELARKKKALEEELDELKGNTVQGKAVCAFVFLLLLGLSMGLFVGMVKLDVGGFAGNVLAPLIGDVPVVRSILPAEMQRKTPSELAAEQAQAADMQVQSEAEAQVADVQTKAADAAAQATEEQAADAQAKANVTVQADAATQAAEAQAADAQAKANVTAQADAATQAADTQAQTDASAQAADAQADTSAQAADAQAQTDASTQATDAQAQAEAEAAKALQDYVDTYSAMNPQDAAQLFESMIPSQEDVVISILENLTPEGRAAILSNMSTANAADLTIQMQRKMEAKTQY